MRRCKYVDGGQGVRRCQYVDGVGREHVLPCGFEAARWRDEGLCCCQQQKLGRFGHGSAVIDAGLRGALWAVTARHGNAAMD